MVKDATRDAIWLMLVIVGTTLIAFVLAIWVAIMYPRDPLVTALRSVDAVYGQRVMGVSDNYGQVDYAKLYPIVRDYNKSVGIDRNYILNDDYANMIEQLTGGYYTLSYSYIVLKQ